MWAERRIRRTIRQLLVIRFWFESEKKQDWEYRTFFSLLRFQHIEDFYTQHI